MATKAFHKTPFDKATHTKVEVFSAYLNESLPVFVHQKYWTEIYIYDLFAGKGLDEDGDFGTALNILKGISQHCESIVTNQKQLFVILNDKQESEALKTNVELFLENCEKSCSQQQCILKEKKYAQLIIKGEDFKEYFSKTIYPGLQKKKDAIKLIFLDPFNFIMDNDLFSKLLSLSKTDFICFIPTTFLRRFPTEPKFKQFIDEQGITFSEHKYNHSHRAIAKYIRNLIPSNKEYYIGHFSIEKPQRNGHGKNYYGVIFGSNNTLGAEKFQKVCWNIDKTIGEADYDIDREPTYGGKQDLFNTVPLKLESFQYDLTNLVLKKQIKTDIDAYKFALKSCCQPKHAVNVLKKMMINKQIQEFKTHNQDIHKIKNPTNIILL